MPTTLRKSYGRIDNTQTKDLGHGVVNVIVSTNTKDRHGEILDIKGLDLKQYSGVVFVNHDYEQLPIGKSLGLKKTSDGKLIAKTQFAIEEFELASTVYKLVKGGYMPDVSIGFIPKDFDASTNTWTKSEMIEYSHVGIGANPEAKVQKGLKEIGMNSDEFKQQILDHAAHIKTLETEGDSADEENPKEVDKSETVTKGGVADVLSAQDKYDMLEDFWEVVYAFADAYYSSDAKVGDFNTLLTECIAILQTIVDGNYQYEDEDDGDEGMSLIGLSLRKDHREVLDKVKALVTGKPLDNGDISDDTMLHHIKALQSLLSATEAELSADPEDTDDSPEAVKRKRITLVRAKKTVQTVDRVAELAIGKINKRLQE